MKSAKNDLKSIYDFISLDSKKYAELQVYKIKDGVSLLTTTPYIGKVVSEIDNKSIREIIIGNYRVIYRIVSK